MLIGAKFVKIELVNKTSHATQLSKSPSLLHAKENYKVLCNSPYSLRTEVLTTYIGGIRNIYIHAGDFQIL